MKCIRTKQIHEHNSNKIYTQYKQHKANTKTHTHTPILPSPPHTYRNDLTDDVYKTVQLMYTTPYKYTVYIHIYTIYTYKQIWIVPTII